MNEVLDIKSLAGITQDSRAVKLGYLFAALPGAKTDGRKFIGDAVGHGASVVLAPVGTSWPEGIDCSGLVMLSDDNPRKRFSEIAAEFYGEQPDCVVAVTGTNGKTSVVHFTRQLWEALGYKASAMGTLSGALTTLDPVALHAKLADLAAAGITHLAMEASSEGLNQYRMHSVNLKAAGFTNLSRDHLDYHGDMEGYFAAKARLFSEVLADGGTAVLNADDDKSGAIEALVKCRCLKVLTYGFEGRDLKVLNIEPKSQGQDVSLEIFGKAYDFTLPLVGDFQVMNALCALGLMLSQDKNRAAELVAALENLKSVPGRLQFIDGHPLGAGIYVDYAHSPDALRHVLKALRAHTAGRLVCLFGCGGDRDRGKRPLMGKIAGQYADDVIVADDNPRSEDPAAIRREILENLPEAQEIGGRREAIISAIQSLKADDVLVIAGKGHEQGQIFADHTEDFDDVKEAQKAIEELASI